MRELQALAAPKTPQGVLVRGHAGLVINKLSFSFRQRERVLSTGLASWEFEFPFSGSLIATFLPSAGAVGARQLPPFLLRLLYYSQA